MASICRKPRSPYFFACFTLPDGRRTQRSTRIAATQANKKVAMKIAVQLEEVATKRASEAQIRKVLSDIHEQIHGSRLSTPSLSEFIQQWLGRKKGETVGVTLSAYRHATAEFEEFMGDKASLPIHYVTVSQVAAWRDSSAKRSTPRTTNNKLKILRTLFQSAWRDGLLTENPAAKVEALKTEAGARRSFTLNELKAVLAAANDEWRGMILAGLYLGQRLKDIAGLTWANVDFARSEIRLSTSKTGRRQILPIAKPLATYLEALPTGDDPAAPLFPKAYPLATKSGGTAQLSQAFHKILAAAGLVTARDSAKDGTGVGRSGRRVVSEISFHSLRHTATSLLKNAGVAQSTVMDLVGHESQAVSMNYTHTDEATKRAALNLMPDITKL